MALPNETEIRALLVSASTLLDNQLAAAPAAVADLEAFLDQIGAYSTRQMAVSTASAESNRGRLASTLAVSSARGILDPLWEVYFEVQGLPARDLSEGFTLLWEDFADRGETVNARGVVYGTPTPTTVVGDGAVNRCTVDAFDSPLEAVFSETKTIRCTSDQHSAGGGTLQEERFVVRGEIAAQDQITRTGSAISEDLIAVSARRSVLGNASFDTWQSATNDPAALASVTNWTIDTIANVEAEVSPNIYRPASQNASSYSLNLTGNVKLTQKFSERNIQWDASAPAYLHIAYNREVNAGDGTLTLRLGSQSVNVVLAAQTGWNLLSIPLDKTAWHRNWNEDDPGVEIELSGWTTGAVLIDDCILAPMTLADGTYWNVVGGPTPFKFLDEFTVADTTPADTSIIQKWLYRAYARHLPSDNGGTETWVGS